MKTKILFVCLGNICRSPMAEGIFLHLLNQLPSETKDRFEVDSAGTSGYHIGELPDARMRQTAESHGITLTSKARKFIPHDLDYYDIIVAMDATNASDIRSLSNKPFPAKLVLMRDYDEPAGGNVPDPYFGGMDGFESVFKLLEGCNQRFLKSLLNENNHTNNE